MLETAAPVFEIQPVRAIPPSNGTLMICFAAGLDGRLLADHPDRADILREAETSLRERRPVGLLLDGHGRILELSHAHETSVASLRECEEDRSRLAVWFWECSPVCYLTRDHPGHDRTRETLEQAAASGDRVWLANMMHLVEGETEVWWKILDVRGSTGGGP